ncbi:exodeoxyribonuclease VII large subunit [Candidatus Saccharibacteria bacterium]|nr:exodeoxyribonuclease VII large subunit [Candidatus Saccharibacteria bacterium]
MSEGAPGRAPVFTPSMLVGAINQTLEYAYASVYVGGEVANLKISQGKWVFFDLKDAKASVPCFLWLTDMRTPLEDGMKIMTRCNPALRKNGNFSLTVTGYKLVGEGSIKKAYEKLKKKLTEEGLFDSARKREIPKGVARLGVISSVNAAGYADFIKILNARWGGMHIVVAHTQVQGMDAPKQLIRALRYFNERGNVDAIAMIRGGGSADDLACFNDEELVRAVAASKIPVMTGIGHEVDEVLCDLAADVRASTPSNAAELLSFDRDTAVARVQQMARRAQQGVKTQLLTAWQGNVERVGQLGRSLVTKFIEPMQAANREKVERLGWTIQSKYIDPIELTLEDARSRMKYKMRDEVRGAEEVVARALKVLEVVNPDKVLRQGYAILAGKISPGSVVKITTFEQEIEAEIKQIKERKKYGEN